MTIQDLSMWNLPFLGFCVALVVSLMLTPVLIASAGRLRFLDYPGDRKIHSNPIAKVGGVGFGVGVFIAIILLAPRNQAIMGYLLGGFTILLFGVWDDRVNLNYRIKFLGQIVASVIVLWYADLDISFFPADSDFMLSSWVSRLATVVFLVGVTNAFNLSDGLDGLAGGLALLSLGGMIYLAHESADPALLVLLVSVAGGVLGFLRFNTYPARVFMGDGGSQFIGFSLAVTFLMLFDSSQGGYPLGIGLLILGLPILDTLQVMTRRVWCRCSPFVADRKHLHHQLIAQGLPQDQAVTIIYCMQGLLVGLALFLRWHPEWVSFLGYLLCSLGIFWFFLKGYGSSDHLAGKMSMLLQRSQRTALRSEGLGSSPSRQWLLTGLDLLIPLYFLIGVLIPAEIPKDFGMLAWFLGIFLVAGRMVADKYSMMMVRIGLYIGGALVLYLIEFSGQEQSPLASHFVNGFFLLLALFVLWTIGYYGGRGFQLTTLDYLVVFSAVAIPLTIGWQIEELNVGVFMAKMIMVCFAFELILTLRPERIRYLQRILVSLFFFIGLSAWWSL
jgi:UDP-GlcNAc:undecaprenyl-phosphate GlcNAc-1-phosphate transferase